MKSQQRIDALADQITALTARAEAAEAKVIDTEAKCGQEIINLRTQLVAAEATIATLREEFQRHKDQSFKLFTDAVDRADKSEATVATLREGIEIAFDALDHYSDVNDGEDGPIPNAAMSAMTQLEALRAVPATTGEP